MSLPGNAFVALGAAAAWGGGDFAGGMSVKAAGGTTRGALRVIVLAHVLSLTVLSILLLVRHETWPHGAPAVWGLAAGVMAGLGVIAFYIALARGAMGASAAISGLLAAAIPVAVSVVLEGAPGVLRIIGFVVAGLAIWVIAAAPVPHDVLGGGGRSVMGLAVVGGIGFGLYFVALRMANPLGVLEPMALARVGSITTCLVLLLFVKPTASDVKINRSAVLWALGITAMDTAGNLLFIASTRMGRLDVASVLASLYPASTILLAAWQLHERPTKRQLAGMLLALVAVVVITV